VRRFVGRTLAAAAATALVSALVSGAARAPRPRASAVASLVVLQERAARVVKNAPPPAEEVIESAPVKGHPSRTFRGSAARRHQSPFVGPADKPSPRVVMTLPGAIAAMPAILEGGDLLVASLGGALARVSPAGEVRWKRDLGDRIYSSPLVTGDRAIVGSDADRVTALRLKDGRVAWQMSVEGDADTPAAEAPDGSIVIAAGTWLYIIKPSGALRLRVRLHRKIFGGPSIAEDGTIYIGAQDDHLYAFSLAGERIFRTDLGSDVDCAPLIGEDGTIYVGTDGGHVFAVDKSGTIEWRADAGGYVRGGLSLGADGSLLAGVYGPNPGVLALDPKTGAEKFAFHIRTGGPTELGVHGGPLVDLAGRLYFGAADDKVYALDRAGRLLWSVPTSADVDAPLVLGPDGALYAGTDDGRLFALEKAADPSRIRNGLW